jgi:PAS domain-containing protein
MRLIHKKDDSYKEEITQDISNEFVNKSLELRRHEQNFYKIFDLNPCPMTLNRFDNNSIIDVNQAFLDVLGIPSKNDIIGKNTSEIGLGLIKEKDKKILFDKVKQVGEYKNYLFNFKNFKGQTLTGIVSGTIIKLNGEDCVLTICQVVDKKCLFRIFKTTYVF